MLKTKENGFSLIELLIVVVVIGIIAALAVPALRKGIWAAQNGNTFATMRTISSTQAGFFTQKERFGRLDEVNSLIGNGLGNVVLNQAIRNQYVIAMVPAIPTDAELREGFTVTATRNVSSDGTIYQYELTQTGQIRQILP
jgi:prepilin-type N-terminal cleavage/methylation domain-containing protein